MPIFYCDLYFSIVFSQMSYFFFNCDFLFFLGVFGFRRRKKMCQKLIFTYRAQVSGHSFAIFYLFRGGASQYLPVSVHLPPCLSVLNFGNWLHQTSSSANLLLPYPTQLNESLFTSLVIRSCHTQFFMFGGGRPPAHLTFFSHCSYMRYRLQGGDFMLWMGQKPFESRTPCEFILHRIFYPKSSPGSFWVPE